LKKLSILDNLWFALKQEKLDLGFERVFWLDMFQVQLQEAEHYWANSKNFHYYPYCLQKIPVAMGKF